MGLESFILKTDLILKAILQMVKFLEAKEYTSIRMDLLKEELLPMVGWKDLENLYPNQGSLNMKVRGLMINPMDKVFNITLMVQITKEIS